MDTDICVYLYTSGLMYCVEVMKQPCWSSASGVWIRLPVRWSA